MPRSALWDQIIFDQEPLSSRKRPYRKAPPVVANPLVLCRRGLGDGLLTLVITGERAADLLDSFAVDDDYTGAIGEGSLTGRMSWA